MTVVKLGRTVMTPGAAEVPMVRLFECLSAHASGDWGVVCEEDKATNEEALVNGLRILSAYPIDKSKPCAGYGDNCLWVITEADRSVTTLLLPGEY